MEDVLEVYQRPEDPRQPLEAGPGQPQRYDSEYRRNGTANIFMLCEPLTGKRHVRVSDRRTSKDWAHLMRELVDEIHPEASKITLVMDNLNTHAPASLYEAFEPAQARRILSKLEIHYTPKHGSWLNIAEIELSALQRQCLNRRIPSRHILEKETHAWQLQRNRDSKSVNWRFTTADARIKLKRLYPKPADSSEQLKSNATEH